MWTFSRSTLLKSNLCNRKMCMVFVNCWINLRFESYWVSINDRLRCYYFVFCLIIMFKCRSNLPLKINTFFPTKFSTIVLESYIYRKVKKEQPCSSNVSNKTQNRLTKAMFFVWVCTWYSLCLTMFSFDEQRESSLNRVTVDREFESESVTLYLWKSTVKRFQMVLRTMVYCIAVTLLPCSCCKLQLFFVLTLTWYASVRWYKCIYVQPQVNFQSNNLT